MLEDTPELRKTLEDIHNNPKLVITDVAKASGQRVVYFAKFEDHVEDDDLFTDEEPDSEEDDTISFKDLYPSNWGEVVLKVSHGSSAKGVAYLQKEIDVLNSISSPYYPEILYNNIYSQNPETEIALSPRLFVTIEKKLNAKPLSELKQMYCSEEAVINLLLKLVNALDLLWSHPLKLVHRDLKPDNIMIYPSRELVIIDLGIIRETGQKGLTNSFADWGPCSTPYASPEQAINDKRAISYKSDFFSLGVLAYELMTGKNPFAEKHDYNEDILQKVCNLEVPTLLDLGVSSDPFSDLISKMMSKKPYQRPRVVSDIITKLNQIN